MSSLHYSSLNKLMFDDCFRICLCLCLCLLCCCADHQEEYGGKKKEKVQFRLCMSCKNEIRHSVGLYIELDFLLPRYNFSTWLISLLSKTYNNMCQSAPSGPNTPKAGDVQGPAGSAQVRGGRRDGQGDLKNVRLKKFAVAGHWMDSMADWLWRDRQLQLDNT